MKNRTLLPANRDCKDKMVNDPLTILNGDALEMLRTLPDESVQCCVTSPPYWGLRDYGVDGQLGPEKTPKEYVSKLVEIFREVKRVLRNDGTLWLNLGDSYAGSGCGWGGGSFSEKGNHHAHVHGEGNPRKSKDQTPPPGLKAKDLVGIPWMVAFELRKYGWYLRSDIIWSKPNPMPESVTDRPTKAHEYIFLLSKSGSYYFDADAVKEPATSTDDTLRDRDTTKLNNTPGRTRMGGLITNGYEYRNIRSVWNVPTRPYSGAHFATFPPKLITPCILAGSKIGDTVLDPFAGSFTTCKVAIELGRKTIGIELNPDYIELGKQRCQTTIGLPFVQETSATTENSNPTQGGFFSA